MKPGPACFTFITEKGQTAWEAPPCSGAQGGRAEDER